MSRITAAHSMTKMWLTEVYPSLLASRCQNPPPPEMLMSMAAWPSMDPATPLSACWRAASMSARADEEPERHGHQDDHDRSSRAELGQVECQEIGGARMTPSSMTRLVLAISKAIAAVKLAPRRNRVAHKRHRGVRTRRRGGAQAGGQGQRLGLVVTEQPGDRIAAHYRLYHR